MSAGQETDLFQAWAQWYSHQVVDNILWGRPIWWWGRIGNVLMFVSGMTLVADLVGPERISAFAEQLRQLIRPKHLMRPTLKVWTGFAFALLLVAEAIAEFLDAFITQVKIERLRSRLGSEPQSFQWTLIIALLAALAAGVGIFILKPGQNFQQNLLFALVALVVVFFSALIFLSLGLSILVSCVFVITAVLSWPISGLAMALRRQRTEFSIKIGALISLLVGFHFDLLAS